MIKFDQSVKIVKEGASATITKNDQVAGNVDQRTFVCMVNDQQDVFIVGDRNFASIINYDQIVLFVLQESPIVNTKDEDHDAEIVEDIRSVVMVNRDLIVRSAKAVAYVHV